MRLIPLALIVASAAFAAAPDLTGSWKLNLTKSDFGQFPPPSSMSAKVTHADPKLTVALKMASENGDLDLSSNYTTDGKECVNQGFGGSDTKTVASWQGETLHMQTKGAFGDVAYTMTDKWTLSADGKILTIQRNFSSSMGEVDQKLILEKQ